MPASLRIAIGRSSGAAFLVATFGALVAPGCAKGQSDDAAAVAAAREAQLRAEAELKVMKELASKAAQPTPEPTPTTAPATAEPAPIVRDAPAPAAPAPAATVDPSAAACGCKTATCSCVTVTVSLTPAARKPGNLEWDPMGGAPDPQVSLRTPLVSKRSGVFKDQLAITTSFAGVPLSPGDAVAIDAFDSDVAIADPMGTFQTTYPGGNSTKSGSMAAASVTVSFAR